MDKKEFNKVWVDGTTGEQQQKTFCYMETFLNHFDFLNVGTYDSYVHGHPCKRKELL